ncbi:MAG: hypothetical protein OJJ54_07550 [Pseudonocardia sp.]|nr:hypothetical protein [Pseudonocardia sp.]
MRTAYRVLAYVLAAEVVVQAAAIAYALFGLTTWIDGGGVLDKAAIEDESVTFTGVAGFMVHGINGQIVVPVLALALLVVAFFAHVSGGVRWAAICLGTVVVQVLLGMFAHGVPSLGILHGAVALGLFAAAVIAARLPATGSAEPARAAPADRSSGMA